MRDCRHRLRYRHRRRHIRLSPAGTGFESQASQLADAVRKKDGSTAHLLFKDAGLCNLGSLVKAYASTPNALPVELTDRGAAPNGGEFLELGIWADEVNRVVPLTSRFEVKPCGDTKK
jgi:hypothetical protein